MTIIVYTFGIRGMFMLQLVEALAGKAIKKAKKMQAKQKKTKKKKKCRTLFVLLIINLLKPKEVQLLNSQQQTDTGFLSIAAHSSTLLFGLPN